jgi:cytochrome c oxidase assembly protein subunit 15
VVHQKVGALINVVSIVFVVQLIFGAFMAGNKAATLAPTWPDINGSFIPDDLIDKNEGLTNLVDNGILIHFIHRGLAYILAILVLILTVRLYKIKGSDLFNKVRPVPLVLTIIQILLGILTVLLSVRIVPNKWGLFEWLAEFHQIVAMSLLLSLVWLRYLVIRKAQPSPGI